MRNDYLYLLDENQNLISILSSQHPDTCPYWDDIKTEQLEHGLLTFEFYVPYNHPSAAYIINERFIIRLNEEDEAEFQLFRIKETTANRSSNSLKVFAENAAVTDLLGQIIRPITLPSNTIGQAMEAVLQNTGWQLGRIEYAGVQDFKFDNYITSLAAIHQIMDTFDAEIKFRVEFTGIKITGKYIDMVQQRGSDTGKLFSYSYDLSDQVERIEDTKDLVTALIGVGKKDSNNQSMTFATYNPSIPSGYEKQSDWIGNTAAREQWGDGGKHIFGIYEDQDAQNQVDLYNRTKKKLDELSKPRYTYNVGVVLLESLTGYEAHRVRLGDRIQVQDKTFNPPLLLDARIIEKKSSKDPTKNAVTLGDFVPELPSTPSIIQQAQTSIQNRAASGGHVIAYGPTQDDTKGYYSQSDESITIEITNNVHLGYASIFAVEEITSGLVELRDANDNVIESRSFGASDLVPVPDSVYEYVLKLNLVLSPSVGTYKLWGSFDGLTFVRFPDEISFPYDSGEFKIIGTSDPDGYYWHFFKLQVAGSGVLGGASQTITVGDLSNNFSTFRSLNTSGETTFVVDKDQVSIGVANIGQVVSESIVNYSSDDFTFYVNATNGNDENDGLTPETAFASMARALQSVPRMCDGNVTIYILSDINEDINILGFIGLNAINIYGGSKVGSTYTHYTIIGDMAFDSTTKRVNFFYGRYFPRTQKTGSSGATNFGAKSQYVYFRECYISGRVPGTSSYNTNAVAWNDNGYIHLSHCYLQDWGTNAIRASSHGRIHLEACAGTTSNAAGRVGEATIGGQITFVNGTNLLTNATTPGYPQSGSSVTTGRIIASIGGLINGSTTAIDANGGGGTGTTPPSTTPTTIIYDSNNSGRSYRYTKYIGWRSDLDVREGDYGYGAHKGLWFFSGVGSTPPWVGKTIKEIWVYVIRLNEGGGAGTVRFKTHNYLSQPSGNPTIGTAYVSANFKFGEKKWVRLDTNATIKAAFQNNTAKGVAIDGGDYAIFSVAANLKVIYQ